jgi:KDO2-lipid IV(A) lauroyltransferase
VTYWFWQCLTAVVGRLPTRLCYTVAGLAGTVAFYLWPRGRRATLRNFARVLSGAPEREIRRAARRSLANYCRYVADFIRFPGLAPQSLVSQVRGSEGFEGLDAALARGRGALIVCTHFGNWDLGAGAAAARGYPLTVVAETFGNTPLDDFVVGARRRLGMQVVKMEKAAPSLVRALKHNGLLALLIDRPMRGDGVRVRFFGEEVEVPQGPARLALRTGASVIPAAFARLKPNEPAVAVLADLDVKVEPSGDEQADIQRLTQRIMEAHERFIRAYPEQWYMFREMWPRRDARAAGPP